MPSRIRLALPLLLLAGCTHPGASAEAWPVADAIFHRDPRWLGGDAAFSIPLGDGRILWLFGDSFVARGQARSRAQATLVRNTVAIQRGDDPSTADLRFFWRGTAAAPASYFPEEGDRWLWPQHGIRLGRALVLFLTRVRNAPGRGLGFEVEGYRVAVVDDASGDPDRWQPRLIVPPAAPAGIVAGAALVREGEQVLSLAIREPGDHRGTLVRWPAADLAAGRLDGAAWWAGERGFVATAALGGPPTPILEDAGPESSLHYEAAIRRWVHVRSQGFGATRIVVSFARTITGPWSRPAPVHRPAESDREDAFVYAAKGHPALRCAGLCVTYATNTRAGLKKLLEDSAIYYPRFVRVRFSR